MAEEVMEEAPTQEKNKKYITATLDADTDAELLRKYHRVGKIAGFSARDVFEAGVDALTKSKEYKQAMKEIVADSE